MEKINDILEKNKIGNHILSLSNLAWGYRIEQEEYYEANYLLLTITTYAIYKAYYISEQRSKPVNTFCIFESKFQRNFRNGV